MRQLTKNRIIIVLSIFFVFHFIESSYSQTTHTYTLGKYYYLKLVDSVNYELKIGMYGNEKLYGEYESQCDTLFLKTFNFIDKKEYLSQTERKRIISSFSKYLIKDSLLIPTYFIETEFSKPSFIKRDTILTDCYVMTDGHVVYQMKLNSDSIFSYVTGSDIDRNTIDGKWYRKENKLYLIPETKENLEVLGWVCSDNSMQFFNKFLIGKSTGEDRYMYFIKR